MKANWLRFNSDSGAPAYDTIVRVSEPADLAGTLSSSVIYEIDGIIDFTGTGLNITVPAGGLSIRGQSFDISGLVCNDDNYTLFESAPGGSGNVLGMEYYVQVDGANSQVYDLTDATGFNAFEFDKLNYNNCTSLGEINGYRQGLEVGTGRLGGTPTLTLSGTWVGGYRVTTSIVRNLDAAMNAPLFAAGTGFSMSSRFLTDINVDLGATASLFDFAPSNFPNPSTVQVIGAIIQRGGVFDPDDSTLIPNMDSGDICSLWKECVGIVNTHVGGRLTISAETTTTISTAGTYVDLAGTFTASDLQHYDSPANGQLRNIGNTPREFVASLSVDISGGQGDEIGLKLVKWDDSASTFVDIGAPMVRTISNFIITTDKASFVNIIPFELDQNDYVKFQVANLSDTTNVTAQLDSYVFISER